MQVYDVVSKGKMGGQLLQPVPSAKTRLPVGRPSQLAESFPLSSKTPLSLPQGYDSTAVLCQCSLCLRQCHTLNSAVRLSVMLELYLNLRHASSASEKNPGHTVIPVSQEGLMAQILGSSYDVRYTVQALRYRPT